MPVLKRKSTELARTFLFDALLPKVDGEIGLTTGWATVTGCEIGDFVSHWT